MRAAWYFINNDAFGSVMAGSLCLFNDYKLYHDGRSDNHDEYMLCIDVNTSGLIHEDYTDIEDHA